MGDASKADAVVAMANERDQMGIIVRETSVLSIDVAQLPADLQDLHAKMTGLWEAAKV